MYEQAEQGANQHGHIVGNSDHSFLLAGVSDVTESCGGAAIIVPALPAFISEAFELDPSINLPKSGPS